jgi:hypothetical protein
MHANNSNCIQKCSFPRALIENHIAFKNVTNNKLRVTVDAFISMQILNLIDYTPVPSNYCFTLPLQEGGGDHPDLKLCNLLLNTKSSPSPPPSSSLSSSSAANNTTTFTIFVKYN